MPSAFRSRTRQAQCGEAPEPQPVGARPGAGDARRRHRLFCCPPRRACRARARSRVQRAGRRSIRRAAATLPLLLLLHPARAVRGAGCARRARHPGRPGSRQPRVPRRDAALGARPVRGAAAAGRSHRPGLLGAGGGRPQFRPRHDAVGILHLGASLQARRGVDARAIRAARGGGRVRARLRFVELVVRRHAGHGARGMAAGCARVRRGGGAPGRAAPWDGPAVVAARALADDAARRRDGAGAGRAAAPGIRGALARLARRRRHRHAGISRLPAHRAARRHRRTRQPGAHAGGGTGLDSRSASRPGRLCRLRHRGDRGADDA